MKVESVKSLPRATLRAGGSLYPKFTGVLGMEPRSKQSGALRRLSGAQELAVVLNRIAQASTLEIFR